MSDQDSNLITVPAVEINEDASDATAAERETARWLEGRNHDVATNRALKQALGYNHEGYRTQLEALNSGDRLELVDKSAEEIAAYLDEKAAAERDQKELEEAFEKQAKGQAEAQFRETAELREVRHAMKTAFQEATSLEERITKLQRLNELRDDPVAKEWERLSADDWRLAREGKAKSLDGEIANLIQEKQARLQETALHQSAYHEGARATQASYGPPPNTPIGQIVDNNGQPMQLTRADIAQIVQLERDQQNFAAQVAETVKRLPDWGETLRSAERAGVNITQGQAQFIMTLPNGPEVAYHLATNHTEARALAQMNNHMAARELIRLSHQLAAQSTPDEPKRTSAPKPPSPVSGGSSRVFDVSDETISADEWLKNRNASLQRRGKH